jgi:calcium-dependent protein kinase
MRQVVRGYQELARNSTIHRDLKPANILISNGLFKICDFGFSKVIKDPAMANKTCVGSPIYMAPQILDKKDYSAKCDIWSLGIIFYELLHAVVPWTAKSERELLTKIKTEVFPCTKASPSTEKIIRQMLEVSEEKRASLRDLEAFFGLEGEKANSVLTPVVSLGPSGVSAGGWQEEKGSSLEPTVQAKVLNRNYF